MTGIEETADVVESDKKTPWVLSEPKELEEKDETKSNPWPLLAIAFLFVVLGVFGNKWHVLFVIGILVSIFLHELGHFLTARWTGMKATQFFLFMGPRIWSFKRGETEYGLRSIPVGAFVRIIGMNNLDPCAPEDEPRAYKNKSYPRRMLVITAGSMMHFFQAIILFSIVASIIGIPSWEVGRTVPGGAAEVAGVLAGDKIESINDFDSQNFSEMTEYIQDHPNEEVDLEIVRDGKELVIPAVIGEGSSGKGFLGVENAEGELVRQPLWAGTAMTFETAGSLFSNLGNMASGFRAAIASSADPGEVQVGATVEETPEEAFRPLSVIGIVRIAGQLQSPEQALTLLALFNIGVGIFNLLPLLPFDGGHAAIATYERLRSRKGKKYTADINKLIPLTYAVVAALGVLTILTIYWDTVSPIVTGNS